MSIFTTTDKDLIGLVIYVDTGNVIIQVENVEKLRELQVNRLVRLETSKAGQNLIGTVQKIVRTRKEKILILEDDDEEQYQEKMEENTCKISLLGTYFPKKDLENDVFQRILESVPEIDAKCYPIEGADLTDFMHVISKISEESNPLEIGTYSLSEDAQALINGNKFFQRHAIIVGSTGSGKSWTTATILEQMEKLPSANAILFDIHGEYAPINGDNIKHLHIAGPADLDTDKNLKDGTIYLPYWLLGYEALVSIFVDRSDQNAPNQTMLMATTIRKAKEKYLNSNDLNDNDLKSIEANFTIDSPIPFEIDYIKESLHYQNKAMVDGANNRQKQGDFHGKLSRLIARLEAKISDRRLGFLFPKNKTTQEWKWLEELSQSLLGTEKGIKIINFSEVPSDILPLMVSLVANICFTLQQWKLRKDQHPITLICEEAHLYIPNRVFLDSSDAVSVSIFERIAKEGRKYGVGLTIVSQRPSEVNKTVLSQCNNVVSMRLTNADDQNVIRKLLPDNLGDIGNLLPILDVGEAIVVGDASLLPSRVRIKTPSSKPNSGTIPFWDEWSKKNVKNSNHDAVQNWRMQSKMKPSE